MPTLAQVAAVLEDVLHTTAIPDDDRALNGVQFSTDADITRVAAAVDCCLTTIRMAAEARAQLLLVHHGMFWAGLQPIVGTRHEMLRLLLTHQIAVYSAHLPLDVHPAIGNNVLLARALDLIPAGGFARFQNLDVGVSGTSDVATRELLARADTFARARGGGTISTPFAPDHVTRRWGICTGAGADSHTLREALALRLDTIVVGEGPHHTAVEARDSGLVIIYAGHYATETLGVQAAAGLLADRFGVATTFLHAPTGL